jgi:hypothetical protein
MRMRLHGSGRQIRPPTHSGRATENSLDPAWKNRGVWQERDPGLKLSYSPVSTGVGAWSQGASTKEGNGKMTISARSATKVGYLAAFPDRGRKPDGSIELVAEAGGTRVVWIDAGDLGHNPLSRWFGLLVDKLIGPDFACGLANLKQLTEK